MTENTNRIKVTVPLGDNEWHGYANETVWASRSDETANHVTLQNVPFFAKGMSFGDVLEVAAIDGTIVCQRVAKKGGHSTYRVLPHSIASPEFQAFLSSLNQQGCSYETAKLNETDVIVAIDVENAAAVAALYPQLEAGEASGLFDFEEGDYCGSSPP